MCIMRHEPYQRAATAAFQTQQQQQNHMRSWLKVQNEKFNAVNLGLKAHLYVRRQVWTQDEVVSSADDIVTGNAAVFQHLLPTISHLATGCILEEFRHKLNQSKCLTEDSNLC